MELQQINNSLINTTSNSDLTGIKHLNATEGVNQVDNAGADNLLDNNENVMKRTSLANNISGYINNIANTSSITSSINRQLDAIENIQSKMSSSVSTEQLQPDVAQFISTYNSSAGTINDKIQKLDDLSGDSTTYFDGAAGAIPLDIDMLNNSMSTKRSELASTLERVQEINEAFAKLAQGAISTETTKVQQESPFKNMDFGKESADFTSTNYTNVAGSVASSQANAMPSHAIRLLS